MRRTGELSVSVHFAQAHKLFRQSVHELEFGRAHYITNYSKEKKDERKNWCH
jgi:hypothetical protein